MEMEMDESLCCKFCAEVFREPLLLACGHSVCRLCAERQLAHHLLLYNSPPDSVLVRSLLTRIPLAIPYAERLAPQEAESTRLFGGA
jgi:hypothetical protein